MNRRRRTLASWAAPGIWIAASCAGAPQDAAAPLAVAEIDDDVLRQAPSYRGDWITHGRDYAETRFSPLAQIHTGNVDEVGLAWSFETGTDRGLEATPLVVDGVIYTTGSWSIVYAVDARTGELLWRWDPEVDAAWGHRACCDVVNRGAALYDGKVYVGVLDGRLAALDAATGDVVWEVVTVDQSKPYTITGAPRVVDGNVIIGNGGGEFGGRGYVSAYDAQTGELAWRFYIVPGDPGQPYESPAMELAAETWTGEWWKYGGGGHAWDSFAHDPELDLLYVGTGNGSPWNRQVRSPGGGDNLFLSSILALRPATGELVWHYQTTPGDTWDFTATQHMVLADLEIDGQTRKVLMQAPKNGFFYVLDRETGALISAEPFVDISWATEVDRATGRPVEVPGARYEEGPFAVQPSHLGGHNWHPMSYHPETGLVYIPAQDMGRVFATDAEFNFESEPGVPNLGVDLNPAERFPELAATLPTPPTGHLLAWDPVAQEERWRVPYGDMWNGGTLSTAGGVVWQGTSDGRLAAYRAEDGELLWDVTAAPGIIAPPVTYEVGGVQYITVMAGWGGAYAMRGRAPRPAMPGRMLTFALGGVGTLDAPVTEEPEPPAPIDFAASPEVMAAGATLFARYCAACHGAAAVSGGTIPDLRYSSTATFDDFDGIVLGGTRREQGMPPFAQWLEAEDVEAIRAYVLDLRERIAAP